jgi:hypothetical protein
MDETTGFHRLKRCRYPDGRPFLTTSSRCRSTGLFL